MSAHLRLTKVLGPYGGLVMGCAACKRPFPEHTSWCLGSKKPEPLPESPPPSLHSFPNGPLKAIERAGRISVPLSSDELPPSLQLPLPWSWKKVHNLWYADRAHGTGICLPARDNDPSDPGAVVFIGDLSVYGKTVLEAIEKAEKFVANLTAKGILTTAYRSGSG